MSSLGGSVTFKLTFSNADAGNSAFFVADAARCSETGFAVGPAVADG